jgi:hypothetical protein
MESAAWIDAGSSFKLSITESMNLDAEVVEPIIEQGPGSKLFDVPNQPLFGTLGQSEPFKVFFSISTASVSSLLKAVWLHSATLYGRR